MRPAAARATALSPSPARKDACKYRQELTSTGDVITTVSQNPNAIGYASLAAVKDTVKALTVGGVAPTEETVKDGSYVVQRPFVLVTKDRRGAERNRSGVLRLRHLAPMRLKSSPRPVRLPRTGERTNETALPLNRGESRGSVFVIYTNSAVVC